MEALLADVDMEPDHYKEEKKQKSLLEADSTHV